MLNQPYLVIIFRVAWLLGLLVLGTSCQVNSDNSELRILDLQGDLRVHDPTIIREDDTYYVFSTGGRRRGGVLPIRRSQDLLHWSCCGSVFDTLPTWATQEIRGARGIWAPDISFFNEKYHLYYSVSRFGTNDSAIGLVTNKTLDPNHPDYQWINQNIVVRSRPARDNWNAIDGNIAVEDKDKVWLSWGSFWSGIKMKRIDIKTGKFSEEDTTLYSLAIRPRGSSVEKPSSLDALEAPFIVKHKEYWYLFVSFDLCCRGVNSTYKIMVGRAKQITGPYVDRDGIPMLEGGGSLVIETTTENWRGPGHCAVLQDISGDYLVFHAYHGRTGRSELKISPMTWKDGWPQVAPLP
jgi:arabinan endo-1,5-alpha-L-arabinosidase